jgi:NAD(P)H-hydrate epimerase
MRAAEERCFSSGVSADRLMEDAAAGIASAVSQFFPSPGRLILYLGGGNNAGDAIVAARILARDGWRILIRQTVEQLGELAGQKLAELGGSAFQSISGPAEILQSGAGERGPLIVLDGLVGIGARGPLRSPLVEAAREIEVLRRQAHASVVAIDIPSGVDGNTGEVCADAVTADFTVTVGTVKAGLLAGRATDNVGRLVVIPLSALDLPVAHEAAGMEDSIVLVPAGLRSRLPRRAFALHKGQAGRVAVVAGSRGMFGAACLASSAALRAGAGLVTLFVRERDYDQIVGMVAPEVMVSPVASLDKVLEQEADAMAIGPGLGRENDAQVSRLCLEAPAPAVIDADALNALAVRAAVGENPWDSMVGARLLTPHPGEMRRILQGNPIEDRAETVREFVAGRERLALLLKGGRTVVGASGQPLAFNTTGGPGMASGGMGDVLSGVAAALLAGGCTAYDAGCLAAWVCGRAGERSLSEGSESIESLVASAVCGHLGGAFRDLKEGAW